MTLNMLFHFVFICFLHVATVLMFSLQSAYCKLHTIRCFWNFIPLLCLQCFAFPLLLPAACCQLLLLSLLSFTERCMPPVATKSFVLLLLTAYCQLFFCYLFYCLLPAACCLLPAVLMLNA
jgi:hypothetical protein